MQIPSLPHSWHVSQEEAVRIQQNLAGRVVLHDPHRTFTERDAAAGLPFRYVAGLDAAFSRDGERCLACAVLWDLAEKAVVATAYGQAPTPMPYIPGFLSFREVPALLKALEKLTGTVDVLMCDGQGIAHPRRLGIASHLGVLLGIPAVGCAKSRLIGRFSEPAEERGSVSVLKGYGGEEIGRVVRTKNRVRPLFVSPGHLLSFETAVALTLACDGGYRLPEPTRRADHLVGEYKRSLNT